MWDTLLNWLEQLRSLPFLMLGLFTLPLLLLAWVGRTYPHRPLLLLLAIPCLLAFLVLLRDDVWPAVLLLDGLIIAVAVADLLTLPRAGDFAASREALRIASLRKPHRVTLAVDNLGRRRHLLWVRDDIPPEFRAEPEEFMVRLGSRSRAALHYELEAERRGAFQLDRVHLRVRSLLGLWQRLIDCPCTTVIHVYPDMKQLGEYAVLARTDRLSLLGVRRARRVGQDHDFERLRDYNRDDNFRHIDWRTTARRNRLTVRDFQISQSQRLMFMVDCGRMMTNEAEGLTLLDHAFNAVLMLAWVALRQGDSVGLTCFSDRVHSFVPPRGGMGQMNHLLHSSFDRFPQLVESRYDEAFLHLAAHCRKRSLVVLVSNVIDEVNANQLQQYLRAQVGRHLPLGVLLRDRRMFEYADRDPTEGAGLYRGAAAAEILIWRKQVLLDLSRAGVLMLDVFPEEMTAPLINKYLTIKAQHRL